MEKLITRNTVVVIMMISAAYSRAACRVDFVPACAHSRCSMLAPLLSLQLVGSAVPFPHGRTIGSDPVLISDAYAVACGYSLAHL